MYQYLFCRQDLPGNSTCAVIVRKAAYMHAVSACFDSYVAYKATPVVVIVIRNYH
jgi:hypothetical protein